MKQVRTIRQPSPNIGARSGAALPVDGAGIPSTIDCRWRIWRVYGPGAQGFAARDVAEHMCNGAFIWLAREPDAVTWMIDHCPLTVMAAVEHVSPVMVEWVIEQTLAVLGSVFGDVTALERDCALNAGAGLLGASGQDRAEEVMDLLIEFVRFANAARVMAGRFESARELVDGNCREEPGKARDRTAA